MLLQLEIVVAHNDVCFHYLFYISSDGMLSHGTRTVNIGMPRRAAIVCPVGGRDIPVADTSAGHVISCLWAMPC